MENKIPPRPNVEEPCVWSWSVQEIGYRAMCEAKAAMILDIIDEQRLGNISAVENLRLSNELDDKTHSDLSTRIEYYKRKCAFINRESGPAKDRAEAKLYTWLCLFGEVVYS